MRAVCKRVSEARVRIEGAVHAEIGPGLVVLVGVDRGDDATDATRLSGKVARLRIFSGETGKFDRSVLDIGGGALIVSQFTLIADTRKGNRPSFSKAAPPELAESLYESFCEAVAGEGVPVARGIFGADMAVELVNDGPVTIVLDT